jgi:hypothetical protein
VDQGRCPMNGGPKNHRSIRLCMHEISIVGSGERHSKEEESKTMMVLSFQPQKPWRLIGLDKNDHSIHQRGVWSE